MPVNAPRQPRPIHRSRASSSRPRMPTMSSHRLTNGKPTGTAGRKATGLTTREVQAAGHRRSGTMDGSLAQRITASAILLVALSFLAPRAGAGARSHPPRASGMLRRPTPPASAHDVRRLAAGRGDDRRGAQAQRRDGAGAGELFHTSIPPGHYLRGRSLDKLGRERRRTAGDVDDLQDAFMGSPSIAATSWTRVPHRVAVGVGHATTGSRCSTVHGVLLRT